MEEVNTEDVLKAAEILERYKAQEHDNDHKRSIEQVRRMLFGVYEVDEELDAPTVEELEHVEELLEAIDPDDQIWHDPEYVEKQKERGLDWVRHGKEFAEDIW